MDIDEMIKATKKCTKALMKLSYINFLKQEESKYHHNKISNYNHKKDTY